MKTDALIVGAGPVGLVAAIELARYGVSVRILDKAPQRTDKSKALVIWARSLELLERAGVSAGVNRSIRAGYGWCGRMDMLLSLRRAAIGPRSLHILTASEE
jgi:2-polyprenyl-6-methoxyphenol hydroxylase-like FAD-dependent oxidoreductase